MIYKVVIMLEVDTEVYSDVETADDVRACVLEMVNGSCEWPLPNPTVFAPPSDVYDALVVLAREGGAK